ncbi:uncharacterized protein BDCG_16075 [Blastomyces dermatitidis ER-3]|uniref:Uncharacterized protein n=1 Tax=Ajellomyces dermatitidis (strain ER-3 / ATCC MYA-2586) TaxID=559297 RepID=A0ABX2VQZ7_AJEDR|nr:uncharacterized protein BDCG_16075 [Blastomyces dermatitidis ER-3]OAS99354.1 hypothetical protein BDCG_16075 [Blastomyces dermatitidis ER-3]
MGYDRCGGALEVRYLLPCRAENAWQRQLNNCIIVSPYRSQLPLFHRSVLRTDYSVQQPRDSDLGRSFDSRAPWGSSPFFTYLQVLGLQTGFVEGNVRFPMYFSASGYILLQKRGADNAKNKSKWIGSPYLALLITDSLWTWKLPR